MTTTRLCSLRPGAGVDDLRAWSRGRDGVRVVGLGEATRGTTAAVVDRWIATGRPAPCRPRRGRDGRGPGP